MHFAGSIFTDAHDRVLQLMQTCIFAASMFVDMMCVIMPLPYFIGIVAMATVNCTLETLQVWVMDSNRDLIFY